MTLHKIQCVNRCRGFTLLEIVIVFGIIALVAMFSYSSFGALQNSQTLEKNILTLVSILEEARSLTLSGKNSLNYGVYLEVSGRQVTLFEGDSYDENDPLNRDFFLDNSVIILEVNLASGGTSVVFKRLKGETLDFGTIVLALSSDNQNQSIIEIHQTGAIQKSE